MFALCKPISSKKRFSPFRKLNDSLSFTLFENAAAVPGNEWLLITGGETVFLEKEYLSILEKCGYSKITSRYVIVYKDEKPCGIIYFQIIDFKAGVFEELLSGQNEPNPSTRMKIFENYIGSNKEEVLMRLFTCGNNVVSGEYGFRFIKGIKKEFSHQIVLEIIDIVSKEEKLKGAISAVLLKDFDKKLMPEQLFEENNYTDFFVDPNMVVELPENISSLAEYINLFSKKYRNRAKSIFKVADGISKQDFEEQDLIIYQQEMYLLYEHVYEKAKFKLLKLPEDYFIYLKRNFADIFFVTGYFLNGKLIAFSSYFLIDEDVLEAHYIGFDYKLNSEYDLYQNILYHNIESAILKKRHRINLGRTAAEIKTTVGAKAVNLMCYAKPQNTISKLIFKPFINFLQPAEWAPRNPFKEESLQNSPKK